MVFCMFSSRISISSMSIDTLGCPGCPGCCPGGGWAACPGNCGKSVSLGGAVLVPCTGVGLGAELGVQDGHSPCQHQECMYKQMDSLQLFHAEVWDGRLRRG